MVELAFDIMTPEVFVGSIVTNVRILESGHRSWIDVTTGFASDNSDAFAQSETMRPAAPIA